MTILSAFAGALHNFVSTWIFCLMQVIPFFLAFIIGSGLAAGKDKGWKVSLCLSIVSFAGFALIFSSVGTGGSAISKLLFANMALLTQIGAVIIGLAGLILVGWLTVDKNKKPVAFAVKFALPLLFGAAVAFAYKPCVSPALTQIYHIAGNSATSGYGWLLLFSYATGIGAVIGAVGTGVAWLVNRYSSDTAIGIARSACGIVVIVLAGLILSGNMTAYKSFLVGRFAPPMDMSMDMDMDMGKAP